MVSLLMNMGEQIAASAALLPLLLPPSLLGLVELPDSAPSAVPVPVPYRFALQLFMQPYSRAKKNKKKYTTKYLIPLWFAEFSKSFSLELQGHAKYMYM